jgi:hypothetical protein
MSGLENAVSPGPPAAGGPAVNIGDQSDAEILAMAELLWRDLVRYSNEGKYGEFATSSPTARSRATWATSSRWASSAAANT